jgi:trehalose/maltose hydrolase-like predicted phosphorylase
MSRTGSSGQDAWKLTYTSWNADEQPLREALCTLGNGYFATRGAAEECDAGGPHYPGTYLAGGYNRLESEVAGRMIENEDLVNWPNWLGLTFRVDGEDWFDISAVELLEFQQSLDMRAGVLERRVRFRHGKDRETSLISRRLVHMGNPHLAALQWRLTPENWSGTIEVRSALDGTVSNQGVARYRDLNCRHLEAEETGRIGEDGIYLSVHANQSRVRMVQAARTHVFMNEERASLERETILKEGLAEQRLRVQCEQDRPLHIEKVVALYTSRDFAISEPLDAARLAVTRAGNFKSLLQSHSSAWEQLWNRADIELIDGDSWSQMVLRLHVFHLLQTTSFHSIDLDVGVPARGLHGEAYRGHIFWDELFIFPFLNLRIPELTRALLMYRYRRLDEARHLAREAGLEGAMYPWQSGSSGREESQILHLNPNSGEWQPDDTFRQRHVNAALALNVWRFFQATGDIEFLSFYGAEMLIEIARLWAGLARYHADRERYEIHHVVGPDEFHTHYPEGESEGLNNNAYTNVMAAWCLRCAGRALSLLPEERLAELTRQLDLDDEEFMRWDAISRRMFVPFHGDGIISQFEGYDDLEEFDWDGYREKYGDIQRLDRILKAEGDSPNRYKASKQADALMLFYLFSYEELQELFEHLEYPFQREQIPRTIEYYMARTSHGSTLSRVVHSWILARSDRDQAWQFFERALRSDVEDIQGGTTSEGIHLGAMAGTVDIIQRCHTGIKIRGDVLWLDPLLPRELKDIRLRFRYRGHWLRLHVTHDALVICLERGWKGSVNIGFRGEVHALSEGDCREFELITCVEPGKDG